MARLANGLNLNEVWVSGDGKTLFATDNGKGLYVVPEAGGTPIPVTLPARIGGFIASEHGWRVRSRRGGPASVAGVAPEPMRTSCRY